MHQGFRRAPLALALAVSLAASFVGAALPAAAQDDDAPMPSDAAPPAVARISAVDGQVGVKHGDGGAESAAAMNAPMMGGDYLTTGQDGRAEVQLDANTIVRAGENTQLRFTQLNGQADVAQIAQGQLELRVLQDDPDQVQVQTPSVDVEPAQPGAYLISVSEDGNTEVTVRSGSLSVVTPQGTQEVDPGRTMLVSGNAGNPQYRYEDEVALSDVEQWGDQRDQALLADANQAPPGAPGAEVPGMSDLDQDGNWMNIPGYGEAWVPNDVSSSWTPYSDGTWVSEPYYGYTWVAAEPWGWAPYHYGRWAYAAPYGWAWVPGPIYGRPVWSPALVAFFGFGGVGVGIGFNNVGWVPLAPGEYYRPWWGPRASLSFSVAFSNYRNYAHGFIGVPYGTWQHGVIHDVRPLGAGSLAATHFYGGALAAREPGFNTRLSYRPLGANFPQTSAERFGSIRSYGSPYGYRVTTASAWQHFGTARATYTTGYARSAAQPSYSRGYQQAPSYSRGYQQAPSYARGYQQTPSYARGYQQTPSYARGYQQSSYGRGYQPQYSRGYRQSYGGGYRQSYGGSGYYGRAASAPRQSYQNYSRGSAPSRSSSGGAHSHGPGRP